MRGGTRSVYGTERLCRSVGEHFRCWRLTGGAAAKPILLSLSSRPTIARPSLVFGGGTTKFQPVFVGDIATGLLELLNRSAVMLTKSKAYAVQEVLTYVSFMNQRIIINLTQG